LALPAGARNERDEELAPIVYEGDGRAVVIMLVGDELKPVVREAASGGVARILSAWDYTNFLAIWCDLAVTDPTLLSEAQWNCLCEVFGSYVDVQFKMVLVKASPYAAKLPSRNVVSAQEELTVTSLRELMRRAAQTPKSKAVWEKRERQIVRLMVMLKSLETSELRMRDIVERFDISPRTAQRDLEVLLMADYPIQDGSEPGTYVFPKGYKAHQVYNQ